MTRPLLTLTLTITTLILLAATPSTANAATCANSFPNDGHPGPWRTTSGGGTLHGNTVHVTCPNPNVHWELRYCVQGDADGNGTWVNSFCETRSGNGSPNDFSASINPFPCSDISFRTHVVNFVTGGTINKPSGGSSVFLTCG